MNDIITYTATGSYHREIGKANEDAICTADCGDYAVITLADGVSACENGGTGARIAAEAVCRLFEEAGDIVFGYSPEKAADLTVKQVRHAIVKETGAGAEELDSYASTLVFAAFERSTGRLMTFALGDSLVYLTSPDGCTVAEGCSTATPTAFTVSPDAASHAGVSIIEGGVHGVMLCSDGAWRHFYSGTRLDGDLEAAARLPDGGAFVRRLEGADNRDDASLIFMALPR